jgi:hypothetical protein
MPSRPAGTYPALWFRAGSLRRSPRHPVVRGTIIRAWQGARPERGRAGTRPAPTDAFGVGKMSLPHRGVNRIGSLIVSSGERCACPYQKMLRPWRVWMSSQRSMASWISSPSGSASRITGMTSGSAGGARLRVRTRDHTPAATSKTTPSDCKTATGPNWKSVIAIGIPRAFSTSGYRISRRTRRRRE